MREKPAARLLLVRHGQHTHSDGIANGGLTERGVRQAALVAASIDLQPEDVLVASPLRRAQETAAAFSAPFETIPDLREFEAGADAPPTQEMVEERLDLTLWRPDDSFCGGETLRAFQRRVGDALEELAHRYAGRRVVAITHSGVLDAAIRWAYGATPETAWTTESTVPNASVTEILHWREGRFERGAPRFTHLHRLGDVSHLPPELVSEI